MEFDPKIGISTALLRRGQNMLSVVEEFSKKGIRAFELCPNGNPVTTPEIRSLTHITRSEALSITVHEVSTYRITRDEERDFELHWQANKKAYDLAERVNAFYVVKHPFIKLGNQPVSPDLIASVFERLRQRSPVLNSIETGVYRRVDANDNLTPFEIEDARTPIEALKYLSQDNVTGITGDTGKMCRFRENYTVGGKDLTSIFKYFGECRKNRVNINGVQLVGTTRWPEDVLATTLTLQGLLEYGYNSAILFIDSKPERFEEMHKSVTQKIKEIGCRERRSLFASEPLGSQQIEL